MKIAHVTRVIEPNGVEVVCSGFHTLLGAVVERMGAGTTGEGHPRRPAKRREPRVRGGVVVCADE